MYPVFYSSIVSFCVKHPFRYKVLCEKHNIVVLYKGSARKAPFYG